MNSCKARVVSIAILNFRAGVALRHSSTSTRSASGLVSWVRHNITSIYPLGPPSESSLLSEPGALRASRIFFRLAPLVNTLLQPGVGRGRFVGKPFQRFSLLQQAV